MKQMKKTLAVLLALVMLLCAAPTAQATPREPFTHGADKTLDWVSITDAMFDMFLTGSRKIDLSPYHLSNTKLNQDALDWVYTFVRGVMNYPILHYPCEWIIEDDCIKEMNFETDRDRDMTNELARYNESAKAADSLLYGIKGNDALSDVDKCLLLHDRLIAWVAYDYDGYLNGTLGDEYMYAYKALAKRIAVCDTYAKAYNWLLQQIGIKSFVVEAQTILGEHAWNEVYLDGEPYFIDTTWDDPVYDIPGQVGHGNFLQTYATFSASHGAYDYDTSPTSTLYENYFSTAAESEIVLIDNTMYYLANGAKLYSRTPDGTITFIRQMDNTFSYQDGDTTYTVTPGGRKLVAVGDEVFYLAPREVQAYNVKTGALRTAYTPSKSFFPDNSWFLYGIQLKNGAIYVTANNSPNFSSDTVKLHTQGVVVCNHPTKVPCRTATHAATCTVASDASTICPACRTVFQSTALDPNNHIAQKATDAVDPDCYHTGYTAGVQCEACKQYLSGHEVLPIAHEIEIRDAREATCTNTGYTGTEYCTRCHQRIAIGQSLPHLGHLDPDENGNCPRCGMHIVQDPDPVEPEPQNYSLKLNFFQRLIQWIKNLFAKLFH